MAFTESSIPILTGRIAIVTGANGGLGLATAAALAGAGAHVVMAARDQVKAAAAHDEILTAHSDASLEVVQLDLASQASVKAAAATILASHPKIDILINNAGIMATPEQRTADGYELQLGVNHLGHWTLTAELMPGILAADAARIVNVTSFLRHGAYPVDPSNPNMEGEYEAWRAYRRSKLANLHFTWGLQREFERAGVPARSLAAHPGVTNSDLQSSTAAAGAARGARCIHRASQLIGMSTKAGARPQIRAAVDPAATGGQMYAPRCGIRGAAVRRRYRRRGIEDAAAKLWQLSVEQTGVNIDIDAANPLC